MNVMLGEGEEARLRSLDWGGREPDLVNTSTIVAVTLPGGQQVRRLARRDDGACVYLGSDSGCRIHRDFGGDAKPAVCRSYPFGFYPVAGQVAVDCSFSCRSIAQDSGEPLKERIPEWTKLVNIGAADREKTHHLKRSKPISGPLLLEIETTLLGFLADQSMHLFDRVRCCLQFNRLATTGDPTTASAAMLREAMARGLPKQIGKIPRGEGMDKTQRAIFYQWLFLALNPLPVNADLLSGQERRRLEEQRMEAARRFMSLEGNPWVNNREMTATFKQIAAVDASFVTSADSPMLERYLAAKVTGQRFLIAADEELPLVEAVPLFLLTYPMAIWTSRALASDRGSDTVNEEDLRRALSLLDRTLGQVPLGALPNKISKVFHFVVEETDLVVAATSELDAD